VSDSDLSPARIAEIRARCEAATPGPWYGPNPVGMNWFGFTDGFGHEVMIDWIVCGAETGPHKRRMCLDWARDLHYQCKAANVPFFFKRDSDGNQTLDGATYHNRPEDAR
jgi:hypothetical protein